MAILISTAGDSIGLELVCIAGAATWLVATWLLSAMKDKKVL
jgi:hypothetical protein